MSEPVLRIEELSVCFPTERGVVRAVDAVSLEARAGEILAIVGESGCGKSATALSILGLVPKPGRIEAGRILFEGRDLCGLDERALRSIRGNRIAMIFQEPMTSLNPALQIGAQVAEPLRLHRGMSRRRALLEAAGLLERVRIADAANRIHDYPHQLSGGMQQRVMIAMALACGPKLLLADEPTTALDVTIQAQILALLRELALESGAALVLITHDLGVVARWADRVVVMYAGRVVETAPVRELYARPRHPYTLGLMQSVPRLEARREARLVPIPGQPPDLASLASGCAFSPRCRYALDRCVTERPRLEAVGDGRSRACFGYD
jgi:oligopeptide transport system ATP-binding protein